MSISSNTGGALANALIIDAYKNAIDPQVSKGSTTTSEEITVLPSTLSLSTLGSPLVQYGQQFYLDTGTGTTLDNIYVVTSVQHSITPDGFSTQMSLTPSYQGSMRSFKTAIKSAVGKLTGDVKEAKEEQYSPAYSRIPAPQSGRISSQDLRKAEKLRDGPKVEEPVISLPEKKSLASLQKRAAQSAKVAANNS
jgi:hypothetical protein